MMTNTTPAEVLRKAIENLIDAKLKDVLTKAGGVDRLIAHRVTGVASFDIRNAERRLDETIADVLAQAESYTGSESQA